VINRKGEPRVTRIEFEHNEIRRNKVFKTMNSPLTILGAERRLFFVALLSGGAIFTLMHSLLGGILLFLAGISVARVATKHDVEILRVLLNSTSFRTRYDAMKWDPLEIQLARRNA
jgi:type IV secretory pathway TrbD component